MRQSLHSSFVVLSLSLLGACGGGQSSSTVTKPVENTEPPTPEPALPSAEQVLDRFIEVTGGVAAYQAATSSKANGAVERTVESIVVGDKFLVTINLEAIGKTQSGSDGETVWSKDPMSGARIVTGVERSQMLRSTDPFSAAKYKTHYKSYKVTGIEEVAGEQAHVVDLVDVDDLPETHYYSVKTGLQLKQKSMLRSQGGDVPVESTLDQYSEFGGVKVAMITTITQGPVTFTIKIDSFEVNPTVAPTTFDLPDDVKKLVSANAAKSAADASKAAADAAKK